MFGYLRIIFYSFAIPDKVWVLKMTGKTKITNGKVGVSEQSYVYPYENYAYHYLNAWNFPDPEKVTRTWDFGIDHFILTENEDFKEVEVRIMGKKISELTN